MGERTPDFFSGFEKQTLRQKLALINRVFEHLPLGIAVNTVSPVVRFEYANENFFRFYRIGRGSLADQDSFWDVVYEDPAFRKEIRARVEEDVASGDPARMIWENVPVRREGQETFYITARNIPVPGTDLMISTVQDVSEKQAAREAYEAIAWMLSADVREALRESAATHPQAYGDLTELNQNGRIRQSVDPEVLSRIATEYLALLETSTAVYERDGDYALGILASGWCRLLDRASRDLCETQSNREALSCGKWLCHVSCWEDASAEAIRSRGPVDIACHGGLRIFAAPIVADGRVIGAINFGYGDPPKEPEAVRAIAEKYRVAPDTLAGAARQYRSRPPFIVELAKERLLHSASLIGTLVEKELSRQALAESEKKYSDYIENAPDGVFLADRQGRFLEANRAATGMTGYTLSELRTMTTQDLTAEGSRPEEARLFRTLLETGTMAGVLEFQCKNKERRWWIVNATRTASDRYLAFTKDITEIKETQRRLLRVEAEQRESRQRLEHVLEATRAGTWEWDTDTGEALINDRYAEILGFSLCDLSPYTYEKWSQSVHPGDRAPAQERLRDILSRKTEYYDATFRMQHRDGRWIWIHSRGKIASWNEQGAPLRVCGTHTDVTDRKEAEERLVYASYHDHLTGLYNRRFFDEETRRVDVGENLPLTVLMGDIDGLKLVNDAFGHEAGDRVVAQAAGLLREACRPGDVLARTGGDEFWCLLPKTSRATAEEIVRRLRKRIQGTSIAGVELSISFGSATKESAGEEMKRVLIEAETRMYRNKISEKASSKSLSIEMIMTALFEKSHREMAHSARVSEISEAVAVRMGLSLETINSIRSAGLVHDIGKIGIPEQILNKPGTLEEEEYQAVQEHAEAGWRILGSVKDFSDLARYVLEHHERWDGTGYPRGLRGEKISLPARIISIADAYDAMTTERPYRPARTGQEAREEIRCCAGSQFDPAIAEVFLEVVREM